MRNVDLTSFLQRIEVGGSVAEPVRCAYKMDSDAAGSNMRKSVCLGQCNCCDYFTFLESALVLIEETRLDRQIKNLRSEFAQDIGKNIGELEGHEWERVNKRILRELKRENKLKVYGSLLVLQRLSKKVDGKSEAKALAGRVTFWLVCSEQPSGDDVIFFDSLRKELYGDLRNALSAVVTEVKIVPAEQLSAMLPRRPTMT